MKSSAALKAVEPNERGQKWDRKLEPADNPQKALAVQQSIGFRRFEVVA